MDLPVDEIKTQLDVLTQNLLDALEGDDQAHTLVAQHAFTSAIAKLWNAAQESDIAPKLRAVARLVAGWAMNELPSLINDPANKAEIKRELRLFQRTLIVLS